MSFGFIYLEPYNFGRYCCVLFLVTKGKGVVNKKTIEFEAVNECEFGCCCLLHSL